MRLTFPLNTQLVTVMKSLKTNLRFFFREKHRLEDEVFFFHVTLRNALHLGWKSMRHHLQQMQSLLHHLKKDAFILLH